MEGEELQVIEDGDSENWLKVPAALFMSEYNQMLANKNT